VINRILLSAWDTSWTGKASQQLCTVNPDGSDLRCITNTTESIAYLYGVWSPDLSRLAVVWDYTDMRRGEYPFLSLADSSGNFLAALSSTFYYPSHVVWSPTGGQIAFAAPQTPIGGPPEVCVVNAGGGGALQKVQPVLDGQVVTGGKVCRWSTGNTLLTVVEFRSSTRTRSALCEIDLSGKALRTIYQDSLRWPSAALSRDSLTVFQYARIGASGLLFLDSIGSAARLLRPELHYLDTWQEYTGIALSPDGQSLCFAVSADPPSYVGPKHTEVYVMDLATGAERVILSLPFASVCDWR